MSRLSLFLLSVLFVFSLGVKVVYALSASISPTSAYITLDESVTLTSTVTDGILPYTYKWYLNGIKTDWNSSAAIFTPSLDGYYVIYLEVTDDSNVTTRSNDATVTVYPPIPQANFTYSPTYPQVNQLVTFDASDSTAGANVATITSYQWNFDDGTSASGVIAEHSYTASGTYNVTLNVTNCFGYWGTKSKLVVVILPHGPTAAFTVTPETASAHTPVMFDATTSLPGWNGTHEMPIIEYRWDFGDGNNETTFSPIVNHTFNKFGKYYVNLTVYALGATPETDSTIRTVIVLIYRPVGGYSVQIEEYAKTKPATPYLALIAVFAAVITVTKRRLQGRVDHSLD
ncbi:MAG: PKD domain-containing protein [Candidatus Bathyarchaeota archaeon]|nr:PKD domain-containing protein [Candidatus Bathyarchaeota archaeon]